MNDVLSVAYMEAFNLAKSRFENSQYHHDWQDSFHNVLMATKKGNTSSKWNSKFVDAVIENMRSIESLKSDLERCVDEEEKSRLNSEISKYLNRHRKYIIRCILNNIIAGYRSYSSKKIEDAEGQIELAITDKARQAILCKASAQNIEKSTAVHDLYVFIANHIRKAKELIDATMEVGFDNQARGEILGMKPNSVSQMQWRLRKRLDDCGMTDLFSDYLTIEEPMFHEYYDIQAN